MKTLIFGDKNKFAFEIEQGVTGIKGYMKLWIEGKAIGDFKKQDEFIHAIYDFKKFDKTYTSLYEPIFDKMSIEEIHTYQLAEDLIWSENPKDLEEAERRQVYIRFFGIQFDGLCSFISTYKDNYITWFVWYYKKNKDEYRSFKIKLEDYKKATTEFTIWFNKNLSEKYPPI
ncbi:MAG: hypothetical protein IPJ81_08810 [Chitinophagaceae bacterium]|nr:hypothetical protein [Chitinophagaceae bacterium]